MLEIQVITERPTDFPNHYCARRAFHYGGRDYHANFCCLYWTLAEAREDMIAQGLGYCPAFPGDDPVIVETWL